jgi:hypothetical protein
LTTRLIFPKDSATTTKPPAFVLPTRQAQPNNRRFMTKLAPSDTATDSAGATATTNAATAATASNNFHALALYGGDHAGLSATFDLRSGKLLAVPDYLVPEALLEWGQAPSALEVLVSEDFNNDAIIMDKQDDQTSNNNIRSNSPLLQSSCCSFQRHTVAIMPAVGCGVDNLQVEKAPVEDVYVVIPQGEATALMGISTTTRHGTSRPQQHSMEATFAWPVAGEQNIGKNHRVRVMIPFTLAATHSFAAEEAAAADSSAEVRTAIPPIQLQSPIRVISERQFDATSSRGTRADGGGLDGQSITQWLGPALHSSATRNFAEAAPKEEETHVAAAAAAAAAVTSVSFPGNITISHGFQRHLDNNSAGEIDAPPVWFLEISHMTLGQNTRNVARRIFPLSSDMHAATAWTMKDVHAKSTVVYSVQQQGLMT